MKTVPTTVRILALLGAAASAGHAAAQDVACIESEGPFAGSYAALSVAAGNGAGLAIDRVLLKPPGFSNAPPGPWSNAFTGPARPDFGRAALFGDPTRLGCGGQPCGVPTVPLDLDAFSTGLDVILADQNGTIRITGDSWGALVFSVSPGTQGSAGPEGQAIRDEVASAEGAAADLFTFIFDGPNVPVPPQFVGRTMRSQDSTEMGLQMAAGGPNDLDGVDLNMVAFRLDPLVFGQLPARPRSFFFSVSTASVPDVPACWWNGTTPSGGTVLRVVWDPAKRAWSCPEPAWTYGDLGLDVTDDLTALSVDEGRQYLLFSSTNPVLDPLLFYNYGNDGAGTGSEALTYVETGGQTNEVSEKLGLQVLDVIDAVCSLDPGPLDRNACVPSLGSLMFAQLLPPEFAPLIPYTLNSSGFRTVQGTTPMFATYMIGWPPPGIGGEALFLHLPTGITFSRFARNLTSGFCGGPEEIVFALPTTAIGPACVPFSWFAVGPPFRFIDLAAAYTVQLMVP